MTDLAYKKLRGCDRKVPFHTKKLAEDSAQTTRRHSRFNGCNPRKLMAYHCGFCGLWHVGHERGGRSWLKVTTTYPAAAPSRFS